MAGPHTWISNTGSVEAAGFSTGLLPATGEVVICDGDASQFSMSSNLDALAAVYLDKIWTKRNYSGNLGVPGSGLQCDCAHFTIQGIGTVYWEEQGLQATSVVVDSPNIVLAFRFVSSAADITPKVICRTGRTEILGAVDDLDLRVVPPVGGDPSPQVVIRPSDSFAVTAGVISDGVVENSRGGGTSLTVLGGEWIQHNSCTLVPVVFGGVLDVRAPMGIPSLYGGHMVATHQDVEFNRLDIYPGQSYETSPEATVANINDYAALIPDY